MARFNRVKTKEQDIDNIVFDIEAEFDEALEPNMELEEQTLVQSLLKEERVNLKGEISEVCSIWQIRRNFLVLMYLLSMNSFCFFLINF